jgi:hypothetical protein
MIIKSMGTRRDVFLSSDIMNSKGNSRESLEPNPLNRATDILLAVSTVQYPTAMPNKCQMPKQDGEVFNFFQTTGSSASS